VLRYTVKCTSLCSRLKAGVAVERNYQLKASTTERGQKVAESTTSKSDMTSIAVLKFDFPAFRIVNVSRSVAV
jgi:hypothetical protein